MMKHKKINLLFILIGTLFMFTIPNNILANCQLTLSQQKRISLELQQLVTLDQLDRNIKQDNLLSEKVDWKKITKRDLERRKRVKEIFSEDCPHSSKDYLAAALIYQHGDTPAHYYQAYLWAKKAVEQGDNSGKDLEALTIDRYLVSIGRKQLFGSQFLLTTVKPHKTCFCRQSVEMSFPDSLRKAYSGYTLKERYDKNVEIWKMQNLSIRQCKDNLKPTPRNTIPGLW
jgi:TPR repeat protein